MSSLGSWMKIHSPQGFRSVNSGLDIHVYSLTNANSQVLRAHLHDMANTTGNLPSSRDLQASFENNSPNTSAIVDCVQQRSKHDLPHNPPTTAMPQRDQNVTPPSRPIPSDDAQFDYGRRANRTAIRKQAKRVYSIETLLKLRETQSAVPVILRVKPESIAENIFQYTGVVSTRRLPTRSRGLSDMSNISRRSIDYDHHAAFKSAGPSSAIQTLRQSVAPPATSALQRNDGFFRFLKQHASPPHQRVTAGGRIVPAGPSSPPPIFDFASLNGLVRDRPPAATAGQKEGNLNIKTLYPQTVQTQTIPSMTLGGYLANQGDSTNGQQVTSASSMQASVPYNNVALGNQPFVTSAVQMSTTVVPLGAFPDGSNIISFNGTNYRTYWNGMSLVMEPLSATPLPAESQMYAAAAAAYSQPPLKIPHLTFVNQPIQATASLMPLASASNEARTHALRLNGHSQHQAAGDENEEDKKAQLSNLDKYLALHHYNITPEERTAFVSQRRHLIEEIDKIRARREQTKCTIPIIQPATGALITPAGQPNSQSQNTSVPPMGQLGVAKKSAPTKTGANNRCLSPAAPTFVPRSMQNAHSVSQGACPGKEDTKQNEQGKVFEPRAVQKTTLNIMDISNTAISRKGKALHADTSNIPIASHKEESLCSVLDPSDPAIRVIEYEDIEYAARYLYNWTLDTKTFCTTVEEFQEAIRRVREQARMFGCAGGSSKDPAYDAEQDLWWAICERDPIPLPTKIPDHVTNPRSWNWNDSAFNCRRKGAPWPGPACEHARNSPRLSGWDPAITDSMKDVIDVSRSYYALKGQLPSVPFRDYAYDRHGNKVKIEPEVTDPAASFGASRRQKNIDRSSTNGINEATQDAPTVESKALKDLTTSDLNGRRIGPIRTSRAKSSRKKNFTDGDILRPMPTLSADKPTEPKANADPGTHTALPASTTLIPDARAGTATRMSQPRTRPYQPYVEDYPETPKPRHRRVDFQGSPTPRKDATSTSSNFHESRDLNFKDTKAAKPSEQVYQQNSETYNVYGKPQDIDDLWSGPAADPITLEYLARLKTWRPGDPDVLEIMQAEANECAEHDLSLPEESSYELQGEYTGRIGNLANYGNYEASVSTASCPPSKEYLGDWNTGDLSAHTRSQWGMDDDIQSFESHDPWGATNNDAQSITHKAGKTAKVSIPSTTYAPGPSVRDYSIGIFSGGFGDRKALDEDEFESINVPRQANKDSHHFLRNMLKSPPYNLSQTQKAAEQVSVALKSSRNNKISDAKAIKTTCTGNKENATFNGPSDFNSTSREDLSRSVSSFKSLPYVSISKAPSSLASSIYQAHGSLPQLESVGRAYTAVVRHDRRNQLPQSPVRVNLPSHNAYASGQATPGLSSRNCDNADGYNISTNHRMPVNFGFDGGSDAPAPEKNDTLTSNLHTNPNFDYKGVRTADYETQRPDLNNERHRGEVEDFFRDLVEKDQKEKSDHKRADTERAA